MDQKSKHTGNERISLWNEVTDFSGCHKCRGYPGEMTIAGGRNIFLTFSASQPRCLISRLPAMPVSPSSSLASAITRGSRSLTLEWMALNQAWAVAESLLLRITVCLASGEWISSCLEKQREKDLIFWPITLLPVLGHKSEQILYSNFRLGQFHLIYLYGLIIQSLTYPFIHSFIHTFIHPLIHSSTSIH